MTSEMSMREKIALTIRTKLLDFEHWELTDAEATEIAGAVLDALMEPTEGMVTIGMDVISSGAIIWPGDENGFNALGDASKWVFSGMVHAAKEGK